MISRSILLIGALIIGLASSRPAIAQDKEPAASGLPTLAEVFRIGEEAYVRALAVDEGRKALWVGTSVGAIEVGLGSFDMRQVFTRKEGLANEYVFALGVDPKGKVWMGTNAGGTSILDGDKLTTLFPMHGLADFWVYSFAFSKDGDTWIGTWDGANRVRADGTMDTYRQELINIWVYGIAIDPAGRVWMGTEGGVSMYDGKAWSQWDHSNGLGAPNVHELPSSANTGLGTRDRHSLNIAQGQIQETYNPNYVFAAHYDPKTDGVWFGTWGGGVSWFDGKETWKSYSDREGLAGNVVYSIAQEKDGTLWFGTNKGVTRYDGTTWTSYDRTKGMVNNHVYAIAVDPSGDVWVGTKGGVARFTYVDDAKEKAAK